MWWEAGEGRRVSSDKGAETREAERVRGQSAKTHEAWWRRRPDVMPLTVTNSAASCFSQLIPIWPSRHFTAISQAPPCVLLLPTHPPLTLPQLINIDECRPPLHLHLHLPDDPRRPRPLRRRIQRPLPPPPSLAISVRTPSPLYPSSHSCSLDGSPLSLSCQVSPWLATAAPSSRAPSRNRHLHPPPTYILTPPQRSDPIRSRRYVHLHPKNTAHSHLSTEKIMSMSPSTPQKKPN